MGVIVKGHTGLMVTGALAAVGLHPLGIPRSQRPQLTELIRTNRAEVDGRLDATITRVGQEIFALARTERLRNGWRIGRLRDIAQAWHESIDERVRLALAAAPDPDRVFALAVGPNLIVNAGEAFLVDAWQNTVELEIMKFHGCGTGAVAAAETDTTLGTESTTILNPDSTRATGSLGELSASVFRTIGTLTFDGSGAITEWALTSTATGAYVMWSRIVFSAINVASGDSIQFTYDLSVE